MRNLDKVDVCFSRSGIRWVRAAIASASDNTGTLVASADGSYRSAMDHIEAVLKWVDDCYDQNNIDIKNANDFSRTLENMIWESGKKLDELRAQNDQLDKRQRNAYNHYDMLKSKVKSNDSAGSAMVNAAYSSYIRAKKEFEADYARLKKFEKCIECMHNAQYTLSGIRARINDDRNMLANWDSKYKSLKNDLEKAYSKFKNLIGKAAKHFERSGECAACAERVAQSILATVDSLADGKNTKDTAIFRSVSAVSASADELIYEANGLKALREDILRTTDEYSHLIQDNIMPEARALIEDCSSDVEATVKVLERKADLLRELASELEKYCKLAY